MLIKYVSIFFLFIAFTTCSKKSAFADLELLEKQGFESFQTKPLNLNFHIESKGAFSSDLIGTLSLEGLNQTTLSANGMFGNIPVNYYWKTDSDSLYIGNNRTQKAVALTDSLTKSIWIGMNRMGLLHNLAGLTRLNPPDHYKGDISTWVRYDSVNVQDDKSFLFKLFVQNIYSGDARVWMNDSLFVFPRKREQFVNFPGGSMKVREDFWLADSTKPLPQH